MAKIVFVRIWSARSWSRMHAQSHVIPLVENVCLMFFHVDMNRAMLASKSLGSPCSRLA